MENPVTIGGLLKSGAQRLAGAGLESYVLDSSILLSHAMGVRRELLFLEPGKVVDAAAKEAFDVCITRRGKYEPIAYITGKKEFWSLDFTVTRDTLIPRPDSETLVEAALKRAEKIAQERVKPLTLLDIRILDIGTGTACLLIALLKELPLARGLGVDISEPALQVASHNAQTHGVADRAGFTKSNWCDAVNETFDLIISNPPYIASGDLPELMQDVAEYEPHSALFSGTDGMDSYRALAAQVGDRLNSGGYALFEVGQGQADAVAGFLAQQGLTVDEIKNDLAGTPRCVIARKTH
ncbi:MAG TPA: peptide chain release factor N(5)-glutamine methyltransferase [Rickettsiales bacterium]|nr:peptide chain release factor N(5)-glutamine methyltransferase [Rickettsiales bacterium]